MGRRPTLAQDDCSDPLQTKLRSGQDLILTVGGCNEEETESHVEHCSASLEIGARLSALPAVST